MARTVIPFVCLFGGFIFLSVVWTYENVALNKAAWQKHPYSLNEYPASLAVDGSKSNPSTFGGECTLSDAGREAEWRVDLGEILSLHHICIQYAITEPLWVEADDETKSFLGFSIYVSNTTEKEGGILCFKDTNYTRATIPNPVNITCPYHGRYVIYYNNRTHSPFPDGYSANAFSDLCEVEVYGCRTPGYYGPNCSTKCPGNCQEGNCDIMEGTCLGCIAGYTGALCNEKCKAFKYGVECNVSCGSCSDGKECYHVDGSCPNGCDVGFQGDKCKIECGVGFFGYNCERSCSRNCMVTGECDRVTGQCLGGCQPGWKGSQCRIMCDGDYFGENCNESCGTCLGKEQCHHINGTCLNGCDRGYQGINCTEECVVGLFGNSCEGFCSSTCLVPGKCDKVTGQCEGGCQPGYKGSECRTKCDGGNFGQNCTESCGMCIEKQQCHH